MGDLYTKNYKTFLRKIRDLITGVSQCFQGIGSRAWVSGTKTGCTQIPYIKWYSICMLPSPWDLTYPGIKPGSPTLQVDLLTAEPPGKPKPTHIIPQSLNHL